MALVRNRIRVDDNAIVDRNDTAGSLDQESATFKCQARRLILGFQLRAICVSIVASLSHGYGLWAGSWGIELLDVRPCLFGKDRVSDDQRLLVRVTEPGGRRNVQGSFLSDHLSVDGIDKTHCLACPQACAEDARPSFLCAAPPPCRPEAAG
jgi:hypothetical protein